MTFYIYELDFESNLPLVNLELYNHHLEWLQDKWLDWLDDHGYEAVAIHAGEHYEYPYDDQKPPYRANPHFLRWIPEPNCQDAVLLIADNDRPHLFWLQESSYWEETSECPSFVDPFFRVTCVEKREDLIAAVEEKSLEYGRGCNVGYADLELDIFSIDELFDIGYDRFEAKLEYERAFKSPFEIQCIQQANVMAVKGHLAAKQAFLEGKSEFEINLAYLAASKQTESELPYLNIVATNEHAATLHYQKYSRTTTTAPNTLLIDAGARSNCYNADITRTYVRDTSCEFQEIIQALDTAQQDQISSIRPGQNFEQVHFEMSCRIAEILAEFDIVKCSAESAEENEIVDAFFPHGVGHLLGLQTHDVGGLIDDELLLATVSHPRYTNLRLLRNIDESMVFTIEPGIYFIPSILKGFEGNKEINWEKVESLIPYGGVRIEDNVVVETDGVFNLTRDAFETSREV